MTVEVEATFENGVLKPAEPLPLQEGQRVRVIIETGPRRASQSRGLVPWSGSTEDLEYLAESPENGAWEQS
jgi:predicted DNA-binding antitoxin AbrB/MazE fold protein